MTARAIELLERVNFPRLFITGGCHVFALALRSEFPAYPLVRIKEHENMFAHVACAPDRNLILDAYGWITNQAYQDERGRPIEVIRITEREIREHSGFCWDSAFENLVTKEARKWIELERTIFSGTVPSAIKGYPRTLLAGIPDPGYRLKPICPAS